MNKRHRKTNHLRRPLICSPCEFLKTPMQALHTIGDSCFWLSFLSSLFIQQFCNAVPSWVPSRVSCFFSFQFLIFSLSLFFFKFYTTILRICAKTVNKIPRLHLSQVSHRCSIKFHLFFQSFLFLFLFMFLGMHDVFKNCQHHSPPPLKSSVLA